MVRVVQDTQNKVSIMIQDKIYIIDVEKIQVSKILLYFQINFIN